MKDESSRLHFESYQRPCSQRGLFRWNFTHRVLKPKHSKRSDDEFTWTNRPKNETHPGVPLHAYWHLKEPYALGSSSCTMYKLYSSFVEPLAEAMLRGESGRSWREGRRRVSGNGGATRAPSRGRQATHHCTANGVVSGEGRVDVVEAVASWVFHGFVIHIVPRRTRVRAVDTGRSRLASCDYAIGLDDTRSGHHSHR